MSKVKIQGNASGTGVVTLTAPNTNIDRTITLPDGDISLGVGIDDNATSTAITIDSSESVNIPNTLKLGADNTLTSLFTIQDTSGNNGMRIINQNTGEGYIIFGNQVDNNVGSVGYDHPNQAMTFDVNNAERMRITSTGDVEVETGNLVIGTSGKGIDFSATSDGSGTMTSEVLDDYEEGTWTPGYTDNTNNGTMHSDNAGVYTKVGNVVTVSFRARSSALNGMSGQIYIAGLPFTPESTTSVNKVAGSSVSYFVLLAIPANTVPLIRINNGQTRMQITLTGSTTGTVSFVSTNLTDGGLLAGSFSYIAA